MREKVVLYHEAGALPAQALDDILEQARAIDMAKVHEELAREAHAEAASARDSSARES
jgi:thioredoxin 1